MKSQMKLLYFDFKKLITIIGFVTTFMLACDTDRIHVGAAMWAVYEMRVNALISCMCVGDITAGVIASLRKNDYRSH